MTVNHSLEIARKTISMEITELNLMKERLSSEFARAVDIVQHMRGRVVVIGMGKSGIIGQKIAATLASTGTPAFFVHPGEAFHGDLGMIKPSDVALLISNSGETEEIIRILPFLEYQENKIIAMTGNVNSSLARYSHVVLDVGVSQEACYNNLAPTSSTTCTLVMGDALSVALASIQNFQPEDFARFHPGGSLGKRLLTRVSDVMRKEKLPICSPDARFRDIIHVINKGFLGLALVMDQGKLLGIITDGDIRRAFDSDRDVMTYKALDIMTRSPKTTQPNTRFSEAESFMLSHKVNALVVLDESDCVLGILRLYDLEA